MTGVQTCALPIWKGGVVDEVFPLVNDMVHAIDDAVAATVEHEVFHPQLFQNELFTGDVSGYRYPCAFEPAMLCSGVDDASLAPMLLELGLDNGVDKFAYVTAQHCNLTYQ